MLKRDDESGFIIEPLLKINPVRHGSKFQADENEQYTTRHRNSDITRELTEAMKKRQSLKQNLTA
jgi:hypothetical protein